MADQAKSFAQRPTPPEGTFYVSGVSMWPFDRRRRTGPLSEVGAADVYGNRPQWLRNLLERIGL